MCEHGFVDSRSKAQGVIKAGGVSVDGIIVKKPSFRIDGHHIEMSGEKIYVSRAAHKLKGFLPDLPFCAEGMDALDIGSSTGGFTQVLLEEDANSVTSVDVGSGQLHRSLKDDRRVISVENTDIRDFYPDRTYDLVTGDVSFISLLYILDAVDRLSKRWIILLFKPQFEVGREAKRDRHGVVLDQKVIENAKRIFESACDALGWKLIEKKPSLLAGREGNIEECYCYEKC